MNVQNKTTAITVNLETKRANPNLPAGIAGFPIRWKHYVNCEATCGITHVGKIDCRYSDDFVEIEDIAEALYRLARVYDQDCIAMKVHAVPSRSRVVGPFSHYWTYDDAEVIEFDADEDEA